MSGNVADKATAFKNEVTGSTTKKIVCKASNHDIAGPKKKHVDCKHARRGSVCVCIAACSSNAASGMHVHVHAHGTSRTQHGEVCGLEYASISVCVCVHSFPISHSFYLYENCMRLGTVTSVCTMYNYAHACATLWE